MLLSSLLSLSNEAVLVLVLESTFFTTFWTYILFKDCDFDANNDNDDNDDNDDDDDDIENRRNKGDNNGT